jgi:hypothetical protein
MFDTENTTGRYRRFGKHQFPARRGAQKKLPEMSGKPADGPSRLLCSATHPVALRGHSPQGDNMFGRINRKTAVIAATAIAGTGLLGVVATADAAARTAQVTNLRTGSHPGYDRAVIDYKGKKPTIKISTVSRLYSCGKGDKLSIPGDKIIKIDLTPAQAHNQKGEDVYTGPGQTSTAPKNMLSIRGIRMACDFEGHVTFGIGVKNNVQKVTYRFLSDPKRIVLDFQR